jgi:hypothetical protein
LERRRLADCKSATQPTACRRYRGRANDRSEIKHSAVYLADDLAFTKYGDNYRQPWMIVRIANMQAMYPTLKPLFYRKKTE